MPDDGWCPVSSLRRAPPAVTLGLLYCPLMSSGRSSQGMPALQKQVQPISKVPDYRQADPLEMAASLYILGQKIPKSTDSPKTLGASSLHFW